jgi:hypothetical protein
MLDKEYDFSCLSIANYDEDSQKKIRECGNFWTARMNPLIGPWYKQNL